MATEYTIEQYLKGKVRNISISDDALLSICADATESAKEDTALEPSTLYTNVSQKQKDLACAWLYVWVAGSPTQSGGYSEEDADWRQTENGERMSPKILKNYLAMANAIFEKYDLPVISTGRSGFVGRGIRNPRNYNLR